MSTTPKTCPCGRRTVTVYHPYCAVCIRTAIRNSDVSY